MASITISFDLPHISGYSSEELTRILKKYANHLIAVAPEKSERKSYLSLRGIGKSDLSFAEMKRKAVKEKYGL